jgi:hypothetical protein
MPSSTTSYASSSASAPHQAIVPLLDASRARVRTYTAHALVLFNVYGVPFSSGIWLEYYFTTLYPETTLLALAAVSAAQIACLGLAIGMSAYLHSRSPRYWRWTLVNGALLVCGPHIGLLTNTRNKIWVLVLCQGALTGSGLGSLCAISTRVLSVHYRHSVALASQFCVSAGFAGAGVYTVLTWYCLRTSGVRLAYGMTFLLLGVTLVPALLLMEYHPPTATDAQFEQQQQPHRSRGLRTKLTLFAPTLVLTVSFTPPLYLPLLLAHRPSPYRADAGVYTLLALYSTALLPSALVLLIPRLRLSARKTCGAASILTGLALVPLIWTLRLEVSVPCAVVYGAGLGTMCTLWVQMLMGSGDGGARPIAPVSAPVLGLCVAGAVVGGAAVLQGYEKGVEIVLGAVAGCLVLGGLILGFQDGVRHWIRQ